MINYRNKHFFIAFISLIGVCHSSLASAGCFTSACAAAGRVEYFTAENTYKFCNGSQWVDMQGSITATLCATPAEIDYSVSDSNYLFCNGTNRVAFANNGTLGACSVNRGISYLSAYNALAWCNGTNWISISNGAHKCVFVTAAQWNGNLGGVSGGNSLCQSAATTAGLSGTYQAWLSSTTTDDPESTFTQATIPYRLTNGAAIADNWTDLIDGSLDVAISIDENGNTAANDRVWTNVGANGTHESSSLNCSSWSSASGSENGITGRNNEIGSDWSNKEDRDCGDLQHLYCFEQ